MVRFHATDQLTAMTSRVMDEQAYVCERHTQRLWHCARSLSNRSLFPCVDFITSQETSHSSADALQTLHRLHGNQSSSSRSSKSDLPSTVLTPVTGAGISPLGLAINTIQEVERKEESEKKESADTGTQTNLKTPSLPGESDNDTFHHMHFFLQALLRIAPQPLVHHVAAQRPIR